MDDFAYQVVRTIALLIHRRRLRIPQVSASGLGASDLSDDVAADSSEPLRKSVVSLQLAEVSAGDDESLLRRVFSQMSIEEPGSSDADHAWIVAPVQLAETIDVATPGCLEQCYIVSITHVPECHLSPIGGALTNGL